MSQTQQVETQAQTTEADYFVWFDPQPEPSAGPVKQKIPNIARLSDDQLRAAIVRNGVAQTEVDAADGRRALIALAREHKLWDYKGDVVDARKKAAYGKEQTCGDSVANLLRQTSIEWLTDVAEANDIDIGRWSHCNYGQKVMNLGNVLRGKIKRGEYVVIGVTEWNPENA